MRSEEQLRVAYRGAELPWPDETGAYDRFLRRRARRARRVRVGAGVGLAALLALVVVTITIQPWSPPDRQRTTPGSRPRYDHQLQWSLFGGDGGPGPYRPIEGPTVVASGQQAGFRWTLGVERAFQVAPFSPGYLLGAPDLCVGFNVRFNHQLPSGAAGSLAADCTDEAVQVTRNSLGAPGKSAVFGMVPAATARVRIEVRGKAPVLIEPLAAAPRFDRRYYLTFLPRSYSIAASQGDIVQVEQAVALDAGGRELARWNRRWPIHAQRPADPGVVIAHMPSSSGTWRLDGFHHQRSQCIDLRAPAGVKVALDFPICETDPGWLAGNLRPFGSCAGGVLVAYGVAPEGTTTMRFTFANARPVEARTVHAPPGFTGSFYLVQLPPGATGIRTTALSQDGTMIASSLLAGCHE
jgi:hypothetical protein